MDYKDNNINLKKELKEAFQILTIDTSHKATDKNLQLNINYFYTSFSQVEQHKAISIAITLANKAFSHLVITINNTIPLMTDQDPFTYNATISISRYTVDNFVGIIINIGASKCFIAGYGQFLVFQRFN